MQTDGTMTRRLYFVLGLLILLVPLLSIDLGGRKYEELVTGDVSTQDILADHSFVIIDEEKTEEARKNAVENVPPIFFVDMMLRQTLLERVEKSFSSARASIEEGSLSAEQIHEQFRMQLGIHIGTEQKIALWDLLYRTEVEDLCVRLVDEAMYSFIVADAQSLPDVSKGYQVVRNYEHDQVSRIYSDAVLIKSPQEMRQQILFHAYQYQSDQKIQQIAVALAGAIIAPNFVYQAKETEQKKEDVLRMVQPIQQSIQKGEMIIRKGEVITLEQAHLLKTLREGEQTEGRWMLFFVFAALTGLLTSAMYFVAHQYIQRFSKEMLHLETMAALTLCMLFLVRICMWGAIDFAETTPQMLWYLTPFAGGVILIRMLINIETAFVWMVYTALLLLFQLEEQSLSVVYFLLSGFIALTALGGHKERLHLLRVGLQVGIVNAAVAILLYMAHLYFLDGYVQELHLPVVDIGLAFLGGVLSGVLVLSLIPVFELVGFVTDYQMQELSNRNHPLLVQLRRQSPGTYHHSMNMAALSEAAAEAIGANHLQARIACYYHDVGKSLRPQYFIENQRSGVNPHDRLSPEQSARIIMTHVIDGITIAQQYNLPKPIMDAIETHHGTSLIKYFYVRAVEEAGSKEAVDESLYRYQGRLPDTRESGIIFLADRVEAACRSLKEPSRQAYRNMIQKMVNDAIAAGQLEKSPLTIQEIYTIIRVFTDTMVDIQHHRIEYPNMPEETEDVITIEVPNPLLADNLEVQDESG